jgi:hypothetical protein
MLPPDACREAVARIHELMLAGEAATVATVRVDELGQVVVVLHRDREYRLTGLTRRV